MNVNLNVFQFTVRISRSSLSPEEIKHKLTRVLSTGDIPKNSPGKDLLFFDPALSHIWHYLLSLAKEQKIGRVYVTNYTESSGSLVLMFEALIASIAHYEKIISFIENACTGIEVDLQNRLGLDFQVQVNSRQETGVLPPSGAQEPITDTSAPKPASLKEKFSLLHAGVFAIIVLLSYGLLKEQKTKGPATVKDEKATMATEMATRELVRDELRKERINALLLRSDTTLARMLYR